MDSAWALLFLLFIPGVFGLVIFMNWLEVLFTHREVADEVVAVWHSTDSPDELERKVGVILKRVLTEPR